MWQQPWGQELGSLDLEPLLCAVSSDVFFQSPELSIEWGHILHSLRLLQRQDKIVPRTFLSAWPSMGLIPVSCNSSLFTFSQEKP